MKPINRWIVLIFIFAGMFSACSKESQTTEKVKPAQLEEIDGSEFKRVILTAKASERIGITTDQVSEMPAVRKLTVGGEVIAPKLVGDAPPLNKKNLVLVHLNKADYDQVSKEALAYILPLTKDAGFESLGAKAIEMDDENGDVDDRNEESSQYFEIEDDDSNLKVGERVFVDLPLRNNGEQQKVVPYAAVIYGVNGETWVYTNPEPLVFLRQPIVISYIEGDQAFLSEGPDIGTAVVTVGVAELYGAETGVSK